MTIEQLIEYFELVKDKKNPPINIRLHEALNVLINHLGVEGTIEFLTDLKNTQP